MSGTLDVKLGNKLFSKFHQRYIELVVIQNEIIHESIHYEIRLYNDNKTKTSSYLHSFIVNPISLNCHINNLNSTKHPFTFCFNCQEKTIYFSAHSKYECNAWYYVFQQLQWQYQPNININNTKQREYSISSTIISNITPSISSSKNSDDIVDINIENNKNNEILKYILSLNNNNYKYVKYSKYYNSKLYSDNNC
eukprot:344939_1